MNGDNIMFSQKITPSKGGQNPPNTSKKRPKPPNGSGQK